MKQNSPRAKVNRNRRKKANQPPAVPVVRADGGRRTSLAGRQRDAKGHLLPIAYDVQRYPAIAAAIAARGGRLDEIAKELGISPRLLDKWIAAYPEMKAAVATGRDFSDADVVAALHKEAVGYTIEEREVTTYPDGKQTVKVKTIYVRPSTNAQIFWLKNRQPEHWKDRQEHEHTGKAGGPIAFADLTDDELSRRLGALLEQGAADQPAAAGGE